MQTDLLDRVRKLLAKAEDEGCTPEEAEALTAKAAELMARYGIDRALLGALRPETDRPADRKFGFERAVGRREGAPAGRARDRAALPVRADADGARARGCTSSATPPTWNGRRSCTPRCWCRWRGRSPSSRCPPYGNSAKAWRRSWMLGYCSAVVARVRAAEEAAVASAGADDAAAAGRRRGVGRAGAGRPLADGPAAGQRRLPAAEEEARHLLGQRLRGRLPRGPEGRHRRRQAPVAPGRGPPPLTGRGRAVSARSRETSASSAHGRGLPGPWAANP